MAQRILALLPIFLLLLATSPAVADDRDEASEAFWAGDEAYAAGDYEAAIEHFLRADELAPNALLYEYIGRAHLQLGNRPAAIEAFREFADSSPEAAEEIQPVIAELSADLWQGVSDAARFSVWRAIRVARGDDVDPEEQRRNELGTIAMRDVPVQVLSEPRGAEVFIDGTEYGAFGVTPLNVDLFVGAHRIEIRQAHHVPVVLEVELETHSGVVVFEAELQRVMVEVDLTFVPSTARVSWVSEEGERIELDSGNHTGELPAGPGVFVLQDAGRDRRIEETITLEDAETVYARTLELEEYRGFGAFDLAIGTIVIESEVQQGGVYVDGQRVGRDTGTFHADVSAGTHTVEVRRDGYHTFRAEVEVEADCEESVLVEQLERRRRRR